MQTPNLIPLAETYNILLGKCVVFYDVSGTKPKRCQQEFEPREYTLINGFVYKVDHALVTRKLLTWHDQLSFNISYVWHGNAQLCKFLRPILAEIYKLRERMCKAGITPEQAGAITEEISLLLMQMQPKQDNHRAFMQWFKINNLVDDFRCRYSLASKAFNGINFRYDYTKLNELL